MSLGTRPPIWLKCYKNASRLNRYNFPTDNAIDFLISTRHTTFQDRTNTVRCLHPVTMFNFLVVYLSLSASQECMWGDLTRLRGDLAAMVVGAVVVGTVARGAVVVGVGAKVHSHGE